MFYEMNEEPENRSIHVMPSDSEVIIASETDGTRHKVIINPGVSARIKKPKCKCRISFSMMFVVASGILLLLIILGVTVFETLNSNQSDSIVDEDGNTELKINYQEHSFVDLEYHMSIVKDVNARKTTWIAEYNKFASRSKSSGLASDPESQKMYMLKSIVLDRNASLEELVGDTVEHIKKLSKMEIDLPESFDAREKWPYCSSIHRVVNQGGCGSCYAVAATSVMSDRICIQTAGKKQPFLSAQDLICNCKHCGGCHGTTWALLSFNHWRDYGIVTGGAYNSYEGCVPYRHSPNCGSPCSIDIYSRKHDHVNCKKKCQPLYSKQYEDDLYRAQKVYWIKLNSITVSNIDQLHPVSNITKVSSETLLKRELMTNGPVLACFVVYEEFQHYKSGIYQSQTSPLSKELYGHCAKLIGWGKESDLEYWIYSNTWGRDFGVNGFFKMADPPEEAASGIPL